MGAYSYWGAGDKFRPSPLAWCLDDMMREQWREIRRLLQKENPDIASTMPRLYPWDYPCPLCDGAGCSLCDSDKD